MQPTIETTGRRRSWRFGPLEWGILAFMGWALSFIWRYSAVTDQGRVFCLFDDALISMRYARNLAQGHGLVWNPGEYVEGYTNPLQVWLMAACSLAGGLVSPTLLVQLLGLGWLLLGGYALGRVARLLSPQQPRAAWWGWAAMGAYYPLHYWALTGMETGAVFGLLSCLCWVAILVERGQKRSWPWLAVLALGLYFSRPDAILLAVIPFAICAARYKKEVCLAVVGLVSGIVLHLLWRHATYGEWLPNTYVLKVEGIPTSYRLANGLGFVGIWLESMPLLALGVLLTLIRLKLKAAWCLAGILPLSALYQIYAGGDPWPYWRIMAPAVPLSGTLFFVGLMDWSKDIRRHTPVAWRSIIAVGLAALTWNQINSGFRKEIIGLERPYAAERNELNVRLTQHLDAELPPDASLGLFYAGMAYWTNRRAVDFLGKCDSAIAKMPPHLPAYRPYTFRTRAFVHGMNYMPGHNKYDLNYTVANYRPAFVERVSWFGQELKPELRNRYVPLGKDRRLGYVSSELVRHNSQLLIE